MLKRYPLHRRSDERGWLIQNDYPELSNKIKHFIISTTKPGGIRGNHYHKIKREWFCVVRGEAELMLYNIETKEKYSTKLSGEKPELVEMEPNFVHTLENIGIEELVFFEIIDVPFDEKNPDTYYYKLK
jgi:UDP-2-acetamido-2,6-beta-L-arabino-hexul-4-ose reductase